jgi:hypothetical protein
MAVHYPADYNVFALVTIEDPRCSPKDKELIKWVSDKLGKEFIATAEDDLTLLAMRDLEQIIGREIKWLTGKSFDRTTNRRKHLANIEWRYCTLEMKIRPIMKFCKKLGPVEMNIGFRYDEKERGGNFNVEQGWRSVKFPLIDAKIGHYTVYQWAQKSGLVFPVDSNCVGCFWKPLQQLRKNWDDNPEKMQWFADQEANGRRWKKDMTYENIKKIGLQEEFHFGTGAGCQAGYCTD